MRMDRMTGDSGLNGLTWPCRSAVVAVLLGFGCASYSSNGIGSIERYIPVVISTEGMAARDLFGSLYFRIGGTSDAFRPVGSWIDWEFRTWLPSKPFDLFQTSFSSLRLWPDEYGFEPDEGEYFPNVIHDRFDLCETECTIEFYYNERSARQIDPRSGFWDRSPEDWQYGRLEYRWEDRVRTSRLVSYDEDTGYGVLDVGMITIEPLGDELRVEIAPQTVRAMDDTYWSPGGAGWERALREAGVGPAADAGVAIDGRDAGRD
jgi:hypothetical protein